MGKICLSCGLAAPAIAPKSEAEKLSSTCEADKLPPTCEECPTCPNCRKPMVDEEKEDPSTSSGKKLASDC